ncbi:MAG: hypothetical protein AB9880_00050 [Christensenellales bacterium]
MKLPTAYEYFQNIVERTKKDLRGRDYTAAEELTLRYFEDAAAALLLVDEDDKAFDALPLDEQIDRTVLKRRALQEEVEKLSIVLDALLFDREERRKQGE